MKTNPDITPTDILKLMCSGDNLPRRLDGHFTDAERVEAHARLLEAAQDPDNIRVHCNACSDDLPILNAYCCVCGGFICQTCKDSEDDGVCTHDPPEEPIED